MAQIAKLWGVNALAIELHKDRRTMAGKLEGLAADDEAEEGRGLVKRWLMWRVYEHLNAQGSVGLDLSQERAHLAKLQAEKVEFEVAQLRGSLIEADAVELVVSRVLVDLRTRLLGIPTKAAPLLMGCRTIPRLKDELERQIHDALRGLADTDIAQYLVELGGDEAEPAAAPNNKRVGRRAKDTKSRLKRRTRRVANR